MAFIRTSSGLNNQHLFHDVDVVVFVEGGESFSKTEIEDGKFNEHSIDVLFWSKIFEKYNSDKKAKFKAIGSKSGVIKIAEDIIDNDFTTVYAAMDQEFDQVLAKIYKHKNILYTFGYSWENDAWNPNLIMKIITSTTASKIEKQKIIQPFKKFLKDVKFSVYADGYLFSKGDSFIPRPSNHLKIINCNTNNVPSVKKDEINTLCQNSNFRNANVYSFGSRKKIKVKRYCYGHLLGDFCKLLINHILKIEFNVAQLNSELVRRLGIAFMIEHMDTDIQNHYKALFE